MAEGDGTFDEPCATGLVTGVDGFESLCVRTKPSTVPRPASSVPTAAMIAGQLFPPPPEPLPLMP